MAAPFDEYRHKTRRDVQSMRPGTDWAMRNAHTAICRAEISARNAWTAARLSDIAGEGWTADAQDAASAAEAAMRCYLPDDNASFGGMSGMCDSGALLQAAVRRAESALTDSALEPAVRDEITEALQLLRQADRHLTYAYWFWERECTYAEVDALIDA